MSRRLTKSALISNLSHANEKLKRDQAELAIETFFKAITEQLACNGRVELRGFGSFSTKLHHERAARNPRTGQVISLAARRLPCFRASRRLREQIRRSVDEEQ